MDIQNLIATCATVIAIATFAGLGLMRGTVTNLRENLKDARDEIADKDRRNIEKDTKIATLEADLEATQRMKTSKVEIENIARKLDEHHEAAMAGQGKINDLLKAAVRRLDSVSESLSSMVDKIVLALRRNSQ